VSLAYLRDTTRKPFRHGVIVTIQRGPYAPKYTAEIVGAKDDWVRVRDVETNHVSLVHHEDVSF
jgi:hypothetical protein